MLQKESPIRIASPLFSTLLNIRLLFILVDRCFCWATYSLIVVKFQVKQVCLLPTRSGVGCALGGHRTTTNLYKHHFFCYNNYCTRITVALATSTLLVKSSEISFFFVTWNSQHLSQKDLNKNKTHPSFNIKKSILYMYIYEEKNMHNFKNVEIPLVLWLYVTFYIFIQTL